MVAKKKAKKTGYSAEIAKHCEDYTEEKNPKVDFNMLDYKEQSEYFGKWFITNIILPIHSLDEDYDIDKGWFDDAYDENVDWITKGNDYLIVVQSKYGEATTNDYKGTRQCLEDLANYEKMKHKRLKAFCRKIDWEKIKKVYIYFATDLDAPTQQIKSQGAVSAIPKKCKTKGCSARFNIYGAQEIERKLKTFGTTDGISDETLKLKVDGGESQYFHTENKVKSLRKSFITHVFITNGKSLCDAVDVLGLNSLFQLNYRFGLGGTINDDMVRVVENTPDKFLAFNNGISCLAKKSSYEDGHLKVSQLQVINGAQTLTNLHSVSAEYAKQVRVQIRITDFGDLKELNTNTKQYLKEIVRYNNTQNKIEESDFLANEDFHKSLSNHLDSKKCEFNVDGPGTRLKKVRYQPKRKAFPPGSLHVKFPDFLKKVYACFHAPQELHEKQAPDLFNSKPGSESAALVLFGNKIGEEFLKRLPRDYVRKLSAAYWITHFVDKNIGSFRNDFDGGGKEDRSKFVSIERGYHTYWALNHLLENLLDDKYEDCMKKELSMPAWVYNKDDEIYLVMSKMLTKAIEDVVAASMIEWTEVRKKKMAQWKKKEEVIDLMKSKAKRPIRELKIDQQIKQWRKNLGIKS
jgi:hypothetical protein